MRHGTVLAGTELDVSDEHRLQQAGHHQCQGEGEEDICRKQRQQKKNEEDVSVSIVYFYLFQPCLFFFFFGDPFFGNDVYVRNLRNLLIHLPVYIIITAARILTICPEAGLMTRPGAEPERLMFKQTHSVKRGAQWHARI